MVRRTTLSVALIGSLALSTGAVEATAAHRAAAPAVNYKSRGQLAARWQASQLDHGHLSGTPGHPDWGLTIDTAFMLAADGSQPAVLAAVKKALAGHVLDYTVVNGKTSSAAFAKVLVATAVLKADPANFGGVNVRKRVLQLVAPASAGFEQGRLRDSGGTDFSNVFGQSFGVIGLARSGQVPQPVVDYLLKQRCSTGYFRLSETAGKTCDASGSGPDVDATALAVQALIAARADGAVVDRNLIVRSGDWLAAAQNKDGSFSEEASGAGETNSTGLAAVALDAAGHGSARLKAAAWVASTQLTKANAGNGPGKPDIGAIAFDPDGLADGIANGLGDSRPVWQRATPNAFFALVPVPLGTLTAP